MYTVFTLGILRGVYIIPYRAKFSWVFNFANFQLLAKTFQIFDMRRAVYTCSKLAKLFQTKSSKIAIRENLVPRKFSAIEYVYCLHLGHPSGEEGGVPQLKV